jgi:hypothetical protein
VDRQPVPVPMLTSLLVDAIHEANAAEGKRPKAFDTLFRASDAGKCARQIAFSSLGYEETEPMDLAGEWVTTLGTKIHEMWQEAIEESWTSDQGYFEAEYKVRHGDLISGHCDAYMNVPVGGTTSETNEGWHVTVYELKTMGSFGFDKCTGLMRKNWARKEPEGPRLSAILQGALNALAAGADLLVIGVMGLEAMSKGYAEKVGASDLDRIMAEWHYSREEFEPLALGELQRLEEIKGWLDEETLPPRWGLDDNGRSTELDPTGPNPNWNCLYCSYRSTCIFAGAAPVSLPIPGYKEWMKGEVDATQ